MNSHTRIDWTLVVHDLMQGGITITQLAAAIGRTERAVRNWAEGTEPRHCDGEALLRIWCTKMSKSRDAAPTCDAP